MNTHKYALIDQYILPFLGEHMENIEALRTDLHNLCSLHPVIAKQILEEPGYYEDGRMWFSISSTVHSYYVVEGDKGDLCGRQIWKKLQFALDTASLLDGDPRNDYIQALEPGEFLSIRYTDLRYLIERYSHVKEKIEKLSRLQQQYYRERFQLTSQPSLERIRKFIQENAVFVACTSQAIQARHVGLQRSRYIEVLKMLSKSD